jgi:hypothetical protein
VFRWSVIWLLRSTPGFDPTCHFGFIIVKAAFREERGFIFGGLSAGVCLSHVEIKGISNTLTDTPRY